MLPTTIPIKGVLMVTWSSAMYLPQVLRCTTTVTLGSKILRNEKEATDPKEEEEEEEECIHTTLKYRNESYYTKAIWLAKLHNPLSFHHRPAIRGTLMSVGDIPKIESGESSLQRSHHNPQHLLDCTVLSEGKRSTSLLHLLGLNLDCPAVLISS